MTQLSTLRLLGKATALSALATLLGTTAQAQYCTPEYSTDCSFAYNVITQVTLNTLNRISTCDGLDTTAYSNLPTSAGTTTLNIGQNYMLTIGQEDDFGDDGVAAVWFDWNNDTIFQPSEAYLFPSQIASGGTASISITVPVSVTATSVRMRVRTGWATSGGFVVSDACTLRSSGGEGEDYTLTINTSAPATRDLEFYGIDVAAPMGCIYSSTETVTAAFVNKGADLPAGTVISMRMGVGMAAATMETLVLSSTLAFGDTLVYTYSTPADLTSLDPTVRARAVVAGDVNPTNSGGQLRLNSGVVPVTDAMSAMWDFHSGRQGWPAESTAGLPSQHPLPARAGRLPPGASAARRRRDRPSGGLPYLARPALGRRPPARRRPDRSAPGTPVRRVRAGWPVACNSHA